MQESKYLDTLCNTADGVYIVDANQRIIRWNEGAERILRFSKDQVLNHDCRHIIAGKIHSGKPFCRSNCKVQICALNGTPVENFDLLTLTNDGESKWLNISIVLPPAGMPPAFYEPPSRLSYSDCFSQPHDSCGRQRPIRKSPIGRSLKKPLR